MSKKALVNIDQSLFLEDYATFEEILLPLINSEREESNLPPLSGEAAMDHYLDLINDHRDTPEDNGKESE